jgi:hypothetical protein
MDVVKYLYFLLYGYSSLACSQQELTTRGFSQRKVHKILPCGQSPLFFLFTIIFDSNAFVRKVGKILQLQIRKIKVTGI